MLFRIAQNFSSNISATFATNNVLKPPNLVALKGTKTTTATQKNLAEFRYRRFSVSSV